MASTTIVLCLAFSIGATATVIAWMQGMVFHPVRGYTRRKSTVFDQVDVRERRVQSFLSRIPGHPG